MLSFGFIFKVIVYSALAFTMVLAYKVYWFLCPGANEPYLNRVLFHPYKVKEYDETMYKIAGIPGEDVEFKSSDQAVTLHGVMFRVPAEKYFAIINHGNGGNVYGCKTAIEALVKAGVSVFSYDYRGYGKSQGSPSCRGVVEDAVAAYDLVVNKYKISTSKLIIYGASLGSGVTSELMKLKPDAAAVILDSPFISPEALAKERTPYFNVYPSNLWFKPTLDNKPLVQGEHPPLLIVAAENDSVIPSSHARRLFDMASGSKKLAIFKNSEHCWFINDRLSYHEAIKDFVNGLRQIPSKLELQSSLPGPQFAIAGN